MLLLGKALRLGFLLDLRLQGLLRNLNLFLLQKDFLLLLGKIGVGGGDLHRLALLLLLNLVGRVRLGFLDIGFLLKFRLLDGQFILLDGDLGLRVHLRLIGLPLGVGLGLGDLLLALRPGDSGIFLDLHDIVHTQVFNDAVVVHKILHVKTDNVQPHGRQVRLRVLLYQHRKLLPVADHLLQGHLTHDLTDIALQYLPGHAAYVVGLLIQEILGGQFESVLIIADLHIDGGVHPDIDVVRCGNCRGSLDVNGNQLQIQFVFPLQKRDFHTGLTDQDLGLLPHAGNNQRGIRRCFYITGQKNDNDN